MRALLALLTTATIVGGCSAASQPSSASAGQSPSARVAPLPARSEIGSFGFDSAGMDRTVAPGDNFYQFANGTWARTTAIPADRSNYGMFAVLEDLSRTRTREILDEASKDPDNRIGAAYASFLDEETVAARGLKPIQPWLDRIRSLRAKSDYAVLAAEADRNGIGGPVSFYIGQDDKAPDAYTAFLLQAGLGLPDREYYLSNDAKLVEAREAYRVHLEKMFALAGEADAPDRARAVVAFETRVAREHWTREASRDATKTYNKVRVAQLAATAPGFDFAAYLSGVGVKVGSLVVAQPSAVKGIAEAVAAAPLGVLKDQLLIRSLESFAPYLPAAIDRQVFSFYDTTLSGTPEQEPRWKRGVQFVTSAMGDEIAKVYVARHFPPETKFAADQLVKNVIAAMGRRIDALDWMSAPTKARARAKLAAFTPKIGYPDRWRDFGALEIRRDDLFGNAMRARHFRHDYEIGKLGKDIYRWEWHMPPMEVNAYANFGMIEIVFPAAILQPPFFDPHADPAVNYGGIGAVIGHELSHQFDDQGAKYDETGRLSDWWSPEDVRRFEELGARLVDQYAAYEPLPGLKINGRLTLGENVADLAGLMVAYDAYRASLAGKEPPVIDGFTGDQRFFLGWAQVWRRNYREPNLRRRLVTDPHSPAEQRASIVRNLDPWYAAYDVKQGQRLYLAPAQRVRVW